MKQSELLTHKIELPESVIGLRNDGVVHVYYKPHTELSTEYQLRQLQALIEITGGKPHPTIYEAGEYVTVSKEAREHAIKLESQTPTSCKVVFVASLAHKIIAEFYYKFNKPAKPYRVFSDFDQGIAWLKKTDAELASGA